MSSFSHDGTTTGIRDVYQMSDSDDSITIITHGTHCPKWPSPTTTDEWLAAQLVKDDVLPGDYWNDDEATGVWRCPFCRQAVYVFLSGPDLDFGMEPRPDVTDEELSAFIETFEPIAKPPE